VVEPPTTQTKEEATSRLRARDVGAPTTLGTFAYTEWKRRIMVVHLDQLTPYQGATRDKWPEGVSSKSSWRVITMRTERWGRKVRPITDATSTALEKKKWRYACRLFGTNSLKEGAMGHIDPLPGNDCETDNKTTAVARQQSACNNGSTVESGVFYVVHFKAISLD
jgi:hypothetical protein